MTQWSNHTAVNFFLLEKGLLSNVDKIVNFPFIVKKL